MTDLDYIKRTMFLALQAKGRTSPNPLVGAILVKNNRIIAEGCHKRAGEDHAEIVVLKKAGFKARGSTLYVTLEPCFHYGRTPPCVDAVIKSGIKQVVIGMKDPNPLTNGKSIHKLRRAGIKVNVNFLEKELAGINESFIKYIRFRVPFVVAKCAQTLDGKIATASGQSKWITSDKTRGYAHQVRNNFDAILVGINTVLKDNPSLNAADRSKRLKKIILDSQLRISLNANLFKGVSPSDCFIAATQQAPQKKIRLFCQKGIKVIICPQRHGRIHLRWLFKKLVKEYEITNILIEGGASVVGSALKEKLVDKMLIFIAPKIIGDQKALSSIAGLKTAQVDRSITLKDMTIQRINSDFLINGYIHYRN